MFKESSREPSKGKRTKFFWVNRDGGYHRGDIISAEDYTGKTNYDYTDRPDKANWIFLSINNPIPHYTIRDMGYNYNEDENKKKYRNKKRHSKTLEDFTVYEVELVPEKEHKHNYYNDEILAKEIKVVKNLGKARSFLERGKRKQLKNPRRPVTLDYTIQDKLNLPPRTKIKDLGIPEYAGDYPRTSLTNKEKQFFDLYLEFRKVIPEEDLNYISDFGKIANWFSEFIKSKMGVLRKKDFPSFYKEKPMRSDKSNKIKKDKSDEIINPGIILRSFLADNLRKKPKPDIFF